MGINNSLLDHHHLNVHQHSIKIRRGWWHCQWWPCKIYPGCCFEYNSHANLSEERSFGSSSFQSFWDTRYFIPSHINHCLNPGIHEPRFLLRRHSMVPIRSQHGIRIRDSSIRLRLPHKYLCYKTWIKKCSCSSTSRNPMTTPGFRLVSRNELSTLRAIIVETSWVL